MVNRIGSVLVISGLTIFRFRNGKHGNGRKPRSFTEGVKRKRMKKKGR